MYTHKQLEQVRTHAKQLGRSTTCNESEGSPSDDQADHPSSNQSVIFAPFVAEGVQVNIPEEFLDQFARADSRPESPVASLLPSRPLPLQAFRRCITPQRLEWGYASQQEVFFRRSFSESSLGVHSRKDRDASADTRGGGGSGGQARGSTGKFEAEFSSRLTQQLDVVTRAQEKKKKQPSRQSPQLKNTKPGVETDVGKEGNKKAGARGRKKTGEGRLDDPDQTAVSQGDHSRQSSAKKSESVSSKPASAKSKPEDSTDPDDPLVIDPKDFLAKEQMSLEMMEELRKLREEFESEKTALLPTRISRSPDRSGAHFWLKLPRCASHKEAICTLPVQLRRLQGLTPLKYLERHLQVSHSRRLLFGKVFAKYKDPESGLLAKKHLGPSLSEALGGEMSDFRLQQLIQIIPPPNTSNNNYSAQQFIALAAIAERIFAQELRPVGVEVQHRDLVEQLDFHKIQDRLNDLSELQPDLKNLLVLIQDLGSTCELEDRCL
ncbi:hypothetical protein FHG87_019337 [Trinorchestia longiramus]|nr:hypothetical protein FHG87_019337 [Trinorchestia longiramus]